MHLYKIFHYFSSYKFSFALVGRQKPDWEMMKFGPQSKSAVFVPEQNILFPLKISKKAKVS